MSFVLADRVKETSISSGTGSVVLNGVFGGFQSFASAIGDGNSTFYAIENETRWEVGIGTYTASTNSLSRDTVLSSSNSNNKVELNGVSIVFCTYPASRSAYFNGDNFLNLISHSGILFPDNTVQYTAARQLKKFQKTVSSDYTLSVDDDEVVFVDCTSSEVNISMPPAVGNSGTLFDIKRKPGGTFTCNIQASGSEYIDGQNEISLFYDYEAVTLISDNSEWLVL